MDPGSVHVLALGASTPLGRDPWSSAAAVRAGLSEFSEHPYMLDRAGEPMRVARAPWLPLGCAGRDRLDALLLPAVEQSLAPIAAADRSLRVALALAVASPRPGLAADLEEALTAAVTRRFPQRFAAIDTFADGHAAGLAAVAASCQELGAGTFDACIVAGVDSYLAPDTLDWLEEAGQLHGAGLSGNPWGFVPGEAAGSALLAHADALDRLALEPLAHVLSVGVGFEANRIKTPTVCIGQGLTEAFRTGLAGLPRGARVTDFFCDMNGEPYRADEFGFACLRTGGAFVSSSDFVTPAECWGDVSAATLPLAIALATIARVKGYANGPYAFLSCSSDSGGRGAALLELPSPADDENFIMEERPWP